MNKPVLAATVAAAVLAAPAAAQAHVTLNPREVTAGSFTVMNVRVPNERDDAGTVKVDVRFPDGFYSVLYKKVRGWKVKVVMEKLDQPVEREGGLRVTEQVARMVWTGNPKKGGIVKPGQFEEFPISTQVPEGEAGSFLTFKAYQTYRDGERVRWSGAPEAEHPAPRVKLLAPATTARRSAGA
jgi:periplasmic copper chaperone A